jgi:hypothetical protein
MGHVAVWGALQYGPQEGGRVVYIVRRASWGCGVHYSCSLVRSRRFETVSLWTKKN